MIAPMLEIEEYIIFDLLNAGYSQMSVTVIAKNILSSYFDDLLSLDISLKC